MNKQKKNFLEQKRATCSRSIECEWFVDDYNKEERWILQTVDDAQKNRIVQVDAIICWKKSFESFVQYVISFILFLFLYHERDYLC
jgi:hypothetical protein